MPDQPDSLGQRANEALTEQGVPAPHPLAVQAAIRPASDTGPAAVLHLDGTTEFRKAATEAQPSGDPVEQLAARRDAPPPSEFYAPSAPRSGGDPATDPPFTWRIHPDDRPYDLRARRVIRTTTPGLPWLSVSGPGPDVGEPHLDVEVRDWPYTTELVAGAAVLLATERGPREGVVQPVERGDMDADAFAPRRAL